jgi:hypothetical protein
MPYTSNSAKQQQEVSLPRATPLGAAIVGLKDTLASKTIVVTEVTAAIASIENTQKRLRSSTSPLPCVDPSTDLKSLSLSELEALSQQTSQQLAAYQPKADSLYDAYTLALDDFKRRNSTFETQGSGVDYANRASEILFHAISYTAHAAAIEKIQSVDRQLSEALASRYLRDHGFDSDYALKGAERRATAELNSARGVLGIKGLIKKDRVTRAKSELDRLKDISKTLKERYARLHGKSRHHPHYLSLYDLGKTLSGPLTTALATSIKPLQEATRKTLENRSTRHLERSRDYSTERSPQELVSKIVQDSISQDANNTQREAYAPAARQHIHDLLIEGMRKDIHESGARELVHHYLPYWLEREEILQGVQGALLWSIAGPELYAGHTATSLFVKTLQEIEASSRERRDSGNTALHVELPYYEFQGHEAEYITKRLTELFPKATLSEPLEKALCSHPRFDDLAALFLGDDGASLLPASDGRRNAIAHSHTEGLISQALTTQTRDNDGIRIWKRIFASPEPSTYRLCLVEAFRESGHSGTFPFLSPAGESASTESPLVRKARTISHAELADLRDAQPPELYRAYSLLRDHGDNALKIYIERDNTLVDNPLRQDLEQNIQSIALHLLRHGTSKEQYFAAGCCYYLRLLSPELYSELNSIFASTQDTRILGEIVGVIDRHLSASKTPSVPFDLAASALKALPTLHAHGHSSDTLAATLLLYLPRDQQRDPSIIAAAAQLFSTSSATLTRALDYRELLTSQISPDNTPMPFTERVQSMGLKDFIRLGEIEGFTEVIQKHLLHTNENPLTSQAVARLLTDTIINAKLSGIDQGSLETVCRALTILCEANRFDQTLDAQGNTQNHSSHVPFERATTTLLKLAAAGTVGEHIVTAAEASPHSTLAALRGISSLSVEALAPLAALESFNHLLAALPPHPHLKDLADSGLPFLCSLGWITPDSLPEVRTILPELLRQNASSADCWLAYQAILQNGRAAFLKDSGLTPKNELTKMLEFNRHFPGMHLPAVYDLFRVLDDPRAEEKVRAQGLRSTGSHVIHELKTKIVKLRQQLLQSEAAIQVTTSLENEILVALIGYSGSVGNITRALQAFNSAFETDKVTPLDTRFSDHSILVHTLDMEQVRNFSFSEPTLARYQVFLRDLSVIRDTSLYTLLNSERENVTTLLQQGAETLKTTIQQGSEMSAGERKGREMELTRVNAALERIEDSTTLPDFLAALCDFRQRENPSTTPTLRRITLRMALDELSNQNTLYDLLEQAPSKESLEAIVALVNTNLKEEALAQCPLTPKQRKVIHQAVGTGAFDEDFLRLDKIAVAGKEEVLVHPTRGILGELSGYNCDACWTREVGIMERYPNATVLMFVKNPTDEQKKKLIGACVILKVRDTDANEVFVVRGLNPTQNFITQVKPESFFESFIDDAVVPLAKAQGIKRIVVPGGPSGGAQTNRPTLSNYINANYGQNPIIDLDPFGPNSTFNSYSISDKCLLVRQL